MSINKALIAFLVMLLPAFMFCEVVSKWEKGEGKIQARVFYQDGKEVARQITGDWGETAKVIGRVPDGIVKTYYNDSKILWVFNKKGSLFDVCNYKNNKREGLSKQYFKNGKVQMEVNFVNDKKEGEQKNYYKSGVLSSSMMFKDGKRAVPSKFFFENGKIECEFTFKEESDEYIKRFYFPSGKLRSEEPRKSGKINGLMKTYYEDGKIKSEMVCKDDFGLEIREYDSKGTLVKELKNLKMRIK